MLGLLIGPRGLNMNDIIKSIPLLSTFHYNFLNDISNKKLIKTLISYDFGNNYLNLLNTIGMPLRSIWILMAYLWYKLKIFGIGKL